MSFENHVTSVCSHCLESLKREGKNSFKVPTAFSDLLKGLEHYDALNSYKDSNNIHNWDNAAPFKLVECVKFAIQMYNEAHELRQELKKMKESKDFLEVITDSLKKENDALVTKEKEYALLESEVEFLRKDLKAEKHENKLLKEDVQDLEKEIVAMEYVVSDCKHAIQKLEGRSAEIHRLVPYADDTSSESSDSTCSDKSDTSNSSDSEDNWTTSSSEDEWRPMSNFVKERYYDKNEKDWTDFSESNKNKFQKFQD
jgi:chromosome segregation ATPase